MTGNKYQYRKSKLRNKKELRQNAKSIPSQGADYEYQINSGRQQKNDMLVSLFHYSFFNN
jgi:hypothetical protein